MAPRLHNDAAMDAVVRPLLDGFNDHTYAIVFAMALIDASGVPFPGRVLLVAAGAYAAAGHASAPLLVAIAALGAMASDHAWYWAAVRGSTWPLDLYCRLARRPRGCGDDVGAAMARYGPLSILLGRFVTAVRVFAWPVAAAHGVTYARFLALDALGALVWAALWVLLGWIVGDRWETVAGNAGAWLAVAGAILAAALAAPLAWRAWRRRVRASRPA